MSEIEAHYYCPNCEKETICMFGGSGRNGHCNDCGKALPKDEHCDMKRIVSQSVVDMDYQDTEILDE